MDENTEPKSAGERPPAVGESQTAHRAVPPPPDLPKRSVAPPSPLDHKPEPVAAPGAAADPAVKVKLHTGGPSTKDDSPSSGSVPINTRIIAMVIDIVVMLGIYFGLVLLLPAFAHKLAYLVGAGYLVTRDSLPFLDGQSVGKKAMKIRAVTRDGKPLTGNWEPSLIRSGVLLIPLFALVELYMLLTRDSTAERGIRLGDEWAKTRVIMEPTAVETVDEE